MLELRPNCECCGTSLDAAATDAWICSFECTFCGGCHQGILAGVCPNCSGELQRRPVRPAALLGKYPASTQRVVREGGCAPRAA
jgi:hypothetical protein